MLLYGADGKPLPRYRRCIGFVEEYEEVEEGRGKAEDAVGFIMLRYDEDPPEDY